MMNASPLPQRGLTGSLGFRLAALFSVILMLMLAAFAYYTANTQSGLINKRLETHARTHAHMLAAAAGTGLRADAHYGLEADLLPLSEAPGLFAAEIIGDDGRTLARLARTADGQWYVLGPGARDPFPPPDTAEVGEDAIIGEAPIGPEGEFGRVRLTFERTAARTAGEQIRRDALTGGALMVCLTLAMIFAALRRPMKDLTRAAAFARNLSAGRQAPLRATSSATELAVLTDELNHAAAELERGRRALAYSEQHYRGLVENLAEPVFETDAELRLSYVNPPWEQVVGRSAAESLGQPLANFIAGDEDTGLDDGLRTLQRSGAAAAPLTLHGVHPRARQGWLDLRIAPRRDVQDRHVGFSGAISDVSVHKTAQHELMSSIHVAEAANRTKNEFLANISHEIRTPMNAIIGMTDLVLDSTLSAEQREHLGQARHAAEDLLGIINNILDFSRIESGQVDFEQIPFSLRACVELVIDNLGEGADAKRLKLSCQVDPLVPDSLIGDPHRLRQVLLNLVGNGIKFTDQGFVSLRVGLQAKAGNEAVLQFTVRDSGVGIARDKQAHIFDAFSQADGSVTRRYGGTGLGLTISSELVSRMHGQIEVSSEPGVGSTFSFTARLPIALPATQAGTIDWMLENMPVLVATGGERNACSLCDFVASWQMQPVAAESGSQAIELLKRSAIAGHAFPLVVLGDSPGEEDPFRIAERIQQDPLIRPQVLIMVAGAGQRGDAARCRALGVAAYLTRPFEASDLFNAILQGFAPRHDGALITRHSLRERHNSLHILLAEDNPVAREMTLKLLERLGHSAHAVSTGREALEASAAARFDLILMDVQMPIMNGLEASAAIRKREARDQLHTPIIALTAEAKESDREACLAAGMNGHVAKPIRAAEFAAVLEAVGRGAIRTSDDAGTKAAAGRLEKAFDREAAIEYLGGDASLLQELAAMYLDGEAESWRLLNKSLDDNDLQAAYSAVSTIKGSVGSFAAAPALAAANRIERICRAGAGSELEEALALLRQELFRLAEALRTEIRRSAEAAAESPH